MAKKEKPGAKPPLLVQTPTAMMGLLSVRQVMVGLGNLSRRTLYTIIARGEFPKADCRIGSLPRWSVALFNQWVLDRVAEERKIDDRVKAAKDAKDMSRIQRRQA